MISTPSYPYSAGRKILMRGRGQVFPACRMYTTAAGRLCIRRLSEVQRDMIRISTEEEGRNNGRAAMGIVPSEYRLTKS